MNINSRLSKLIRLLYGGNKSAFSAAIGVSPSVVENIVGKRQGKPSFEVLEKISAIAEINIEWLITGKGDMLAGEAKPEASASQNNHTETKCSDVPVASHTYYPDKVPGAIPLVSEKAVGGVVNEFVNIREDDVLGYYVIPKFRHLGVDFMIEVTGDSMVPRFYPGDLIACSILHNPKFIQWNKSHLLATEEQGLIVKRLMPGDTPDCFKAVSENKDYPPFPIPKDEIIAMALVVGSIHIE
ncbi:MAG: hypothetical protein K2G30_03345 [Muribaculaceae bacterium]|nr:hypothetical protein [Muribaculaceae bacterium]